MSKKTLVIGASSNPQRYSNKAINMLKEYGNEVVALAKKSGFANSIPITTNFPQKGSIDTVTLYIGEKKQSEYYKLIQELRPKRVIFNPGTENKTFKDKLINKGIEAINACTLVMLRTNQY